jgi:hypothetical protein
MSKPLIIPGYPDPSDAQIRLFQFNNRIVVDGIVGPQTRGACWRKVGKRKPYTHLAWHERKKGGAVTSIAWLAANLVKRGNLPLDPIYLQKLARLLSSEWSTGFDYASSQDAGTMGFRRYAGRKLRKMLKDAGVSFRGESLPGKNNAYPFGDEDLRAELVNLAKDREWWEQQLAQWLADLIDHLADHTMRSGRSIALWERACNSSPRWVEECESYEELRAKYSAHKRGPSRILRIEKAIPKGELWR